MKIAARQMPVLVLFYAGFRMFRWLMSARLSRNAAITKVAAIRFYPLPAAGGGRALRAVCLSRRLFELRECLTLSDGIPVLDCF